MKEIYSKPVAEIEEFKVVDVLTLSDELNHTEETHGPESGI